MDPSLAAHFLRALDSDHAASILRPNSVAGGAADVATAGRAMVLRGLLMAGGLRHGTWCPKR